MSPETSYVVRADPEKFVSVQQMSTRAFWIGTPVAVLAIGAVIASLLFLSGPVWVRILTVVATLLLGIPARRSSVSGLGKP